MEYLVINHGVPFKWCILKTSSLVPDILLSPSHEFLKSIVSSMNSSQTSLIVFPETAAHFSEDADSSSRAGQKHMLLHNVSTDLLSSCLSNSRNSRSTRLAYKLISNLGFTSMIHRLQFSEFIRQDTNVVLCLGHRIY